MDPQEETGRDDRSVDTPAIEEYIRRLKEGSLKLYALEEQLPPRDAIRVRRAYISGLTGSPLTKLGEFTISVDRVVKRNCENMIGAVQVPVGVAGPLTVNGEYAKGNYFLPLATTEGALVASVNRGCSAITRAGGAEVRIFRDAMTRAPVFAANDIAHAKEITDWVEGHQEEIRSRAEATTKHGRYLGAATSVAGTSVYVRLEFDTKDAMGMNMVTIASAEVADLIATETGGRLISLSGNLCTDKKPAAVNVVRGRGKTVAAGVHLPDDLIRDVFKTDAATLSEVNVRKNLVGSARAGALGFNAHAANVIAAIFIACGQDPAHVVEGSTRDHDRRPGARRGVCRGDTARTPGRHGRRGNRDRDPARVPGHARGRGGRCAAGSPCKGIRRDHRRRGPRRGALPARSTRRTASCPRPYPARQGMTGLFQNVNHFIMTRASSPFA